MIDPIAAADGSLCRHPAIGLPFGKCRGSPGNWLCVKCGEVIDKRSAALDYISALDAGAARQRKVVRYRRPPPPAPPAVPELARLDQVARLLRVALLSRGDAERIHGMLSPWAWAYAEAEQGEVERAAVAASLEARHARGS